LINYKTTMKYLFLILGITILIVSCSKDNPTVKPEISTDYYPLKIGSWHIYDVDSISYNDFTTIVTIDSASYQVMEEITDTFYDLEGSLSFELKRFKRIGNDSVDVENAKWNISDVWWVKNNKGNIERIEENKIFVSLLNRIKEGVIWDGNAFNYIESWDFEYASVGDDFGDYSNTVTVLQKQENLDNVLLYQKYQEVFAKGVGLVSRTRINVESEGDKESRGTIPVLERPEEGFQFFQRLNSYFIPE
tara:strand:+ start:18545 stop:19288 length:744 start_codon:yes stop_codon:yes gene_type:complete